MSSVSFPTTMTTTSPRQPEYDNFRYCQVQEMSRVVVIRNIDCGQIVYIGSPILKISRQGWQGWEPESLSVRKFNKILENLDPVSFATLQTLIKPLYPQHQTDIDSYWPKSVQQAEKRSQQHKRELEQHKRELEQELNQMSDEEKEAILLGDYETAFKKRKVDNLPKTVLKATVLEPTVKDIVNMKYMINSFGDETHKYLYLLGSKFNHSCQPNCSWEIDNDGQLIITTIKPIAESKECFIDYYGVSLLKYEDGTQLISLNQLEQRRNYILKKSGKFHCKCSYCLDQEKVFRDEICQYLSNPEFPLFVSLVCDYCFS